MNTGVIAQVLPELERFIDRHILGLQPDPDNWPVPHDIGRLPVPRGRDASDDAGRTLVLDSEFVPAWHHRRTAVGAHAYRFEQNREYDCGWRLVDVAARFFSEKLDHTPDLATIVPPPDTYGSQQMLPWLGERLAHTLGIAYEQSLFVATCPLGKHPDTAEHPRLPIGEIFRIDDSLATGLKGRHVLLIDWRRYRGRTMLTLTRMLRKKGAEVIRFAWLE